MHKYQPRIHIIKKKDTSDTVAVDVERPSSLKKTFLFPDTVFTTVTAYQNQQVSPLLNFNNLSILPWSNALIKKVPTIVLAQDSYHWVIDLLNTEKRCSFMSTRYLHSYLESFLNVYDLMCHFTLHSRRFQKLTRRERNWEGVRKIRSRGRGWGERRKRLFSPPLPTQSPQCLVHSRRAPSLARFFARLFDLRLEKERKRLLRSLSQLHVLGS